MPGFGGSVKLTGADEYKQALKSISDNLKAVSAEMRATASSFDAGEKSEQDILKASKEFKKSLDEQKRPSACVGCRACEAVCPQQIKISEMMQDFSERLAK